MATLSQQEASLERDIANTRGELVNRTSPDLFALRLKQALMNSPVFGQKEAERADINKQLGTARQSLTANLSPEELQNLNPAQQRELVQGQRAGLSASYNRNLEESNRLGAGVEAGVGEARTYMKDIQDNLITRMQFLSDDLNNVKAKKSESKQLAFGLANTGVTITPEISRMLDDTLTKDEKAIWLAANSAAIRKEQASHASTAPNKQAISDADGKVIGYFDPGTGAAVYYDKGQPPQGGQTFEQFLADEQNKAGQSFTPAKVAKLKDQFNQGLAGSNQLDNLREAFNSAVIDLPAERAKSAKATFNSYLSNGNLAGATEYILRTARSGASASQQDQVYGRDQRNAQLTQLKSDLAEFQRLGGKTGVDIKFKEGVAQLAGRTSNPKLAAIQNRINSTIQQYTRAISGAAFTDQEYKRYQAVFPDIGKTQELNTAKIDSLIQASNLDQDTFYRQQLGSGYDLVKSMMGGSSSSSSGGGQPPLSSFVK